MRNIFIGGAWPYANGSLHIGHLAALLPGDVLARYHRARGDRVFYVSGSDCHGTPVTIRATQEGKSPREISDFYHEEFRSVFSALGFSYDRYGKTSEEAHVNFVTEFHRQLYRSPYIGEESTLEAYCGRCERFLPDRFIAGRCPSCGAPARGDQCEACGRVLEPDELVEPRCAVCGGVPAFQRTSHLYLLLSRLEKELTAFVDAHPEWRRNAAAFSRRYLEEGLRDRAITRDLDWGIPVPKEGFEDKKIYIWAENVLGYLSMSRAVAEERGDDFAALWGENARHYYVHGKDNIPFHTIILPGLLLAHGGGWHLPDVIVSSEYLTLEGRKISTSQGWALWAKDLVGKYDPDSLRYFLLSNGPEKRDCDFSLREFARCHNGELLGAWGNFVQRTLVFAQKYYEERVPRGQADPALTARTEELFRQTGEAVEKARLRDGLEGIFAVVRECNRYFDARQPWLTRQSDPQHCRDTIFTCLQAAADLSVLLGPYLPFSSARVQGWLGVSSEWKPQQLSPGQEIATPEILFKRMGKDEG